MNHNIPEKHIRVPREAMHQFVRAAFIKSGLSDEDAEFMAGILVAGDLRGVFSHGTIMTLNYTSQFRQGLVNPHPQISVMQETPTSVTVDGDGGLGYRASFKAVEMAVEKAKAVGMAVGMTNNHGHFGSAGHYTRVAVKAGCIGIANSSHFRIFDSNESILNAHGASPISIGVPAGKGDPLIIDMASSPGVSHDFFAQMPATFFKMLGFGLVSHALGGILSGMVTRQEEQASLWKGVNQGAFFIVVDAAQMASDLPTYQRQMDEFLVALGKMQPPPGHERAYAPGGIEAERERLWSVEGIPVGDEPAWGGASHLEILQKVAAELDIETPW